MSSQAALQSLLSQPFMTHQPRASADVIPITPLTEPARYGAQQKPNMMAMALSLLAVGGMVAALVSMNMVSHAKKRANLATVEMRLDATPPAPPPPPKQEKAVPKANIPVPAFAPTPAVIAPIALAAPTVSAAPVSAPMPQPVTAAEAAPGPASPAPVDAAPAIANSNDLASRMISMVPPRYPQIARRNHEQGVVMLMVLVGVEGKVDDISVSKSSGFGSLDHAAVDAVRRWRWSPTKRNGAPVKVRGLVEIPFVLQG